MDASVPPWQVIGVSVVVVAQAVMIVVVMIIIVTMTTLIRGVFPQVRKMARALQLCGADVTYEEVAGKVSRAGGRSLCYSFAALSGSDVQYRSTGGGTVTGPVTEVW